MWGKKRLNEVEEITRQLSEEGNYSYLHKFVIYIWVEQAVNRVTSELRKGVNLRFTVNICGDESTVIIILYSNCSSF